MKVHLARLARVLAKDNEISLWLGFSLALVFSWINMCVYVIMVVAGYFLKYIPLSNCLCYALNFLTVSKVG